MFCNRIKLPILLLFSTAIIILVTGEQTKSKSAYYHPDGLLQSLFRKWQEIVDRTQWISNNNAKTLKGDLSANGGNKQTRINLLSESAAVVGSMVPIEENLMVPQFLGVGRQQIAACRCQAELVDGIGLCSTTCFAEETPCGQQICTRTTTFSAFTDDNEQSFPKTFEIVNNQNCNSLEVSCILSSASASASASLSSFSSAAAITTAVANAALTAGIAVGAVALGVAAAKTKENTYVDQYYETEDHYATTAEYYSPHLYANRQARVLDVEINQSNPDVLENLITPPIAAESMVEELISSSFGRQGGCSCIPPTFSDCSTTCYSYQQLCGGQRCTLTTFFSAFTYNGVLCEHTVTNINDCERLSGVCSASTALLTRSVDSCNSLASFAVIAGALTAGLAAGNIAAVADQQPLPCQQPQPAQQQQPQQQQQQQPQQPQQQLENQTPNNHQPMPVNGTDCPDDGCGENLIRFRDGNCYPIFSSCNNTNYWVTFDNTTVQDGCGTLGKCTPRLCDDRRVFVGRTGLCHDINDPFECPGGRRLYYTAFGDSICDCPIGQYPFPNPEDNCVALFSQGPCPGGQVVSISQGGRLFCTPDECQSPSSNSESFLALVPTDKGQCQAIGSRGSCSSAASQWLGYDIFKRQLQCTNVTDSSSPYFSFLQERKLAKKVFNNQQEVERNRRKSNVSIGTIDKNSLDGTNVTDNRRQGTFGIFQFPSSISNSLLQPCRTGARQGFNQKCTNPLVSNSDRRPPLPPTSPLFSCRPGNFLQSGGQCVNDRPTASCGPSYQFNRLTGQCRPKF